MRKFIQLNKDDLVEVFIQLNSGWAEGRNRRTNELGWFPRSYVRIYVIYNEEKVKFDEKVQANDDEKQVEEKQYEEKEDEQESWEDIQDKIDEYKCPLSHFAFVDAEDDNDKRVPVVQSDGKTYDLAYLQGWIKQKTTQQKSPITREKLYLRPSSSNSNKYVNLADAASYLLYPNHALRSLIKDKWANEPFEIDVEDYFKQDENKRILQNISDKTEEKVVELVQQDGSNYDKIFLFQESEFIEKYNMILNKNQEKVMRDEFKCKISKELMEDPVIQSDGHTYERTSIESWFRISGNRKSPMTNLNLDSKNLFPNRELKSLIDRWQREPMKILKQKLMKQSEENMEKLMTTVSRSGLEKLIKSGALFDIKTRYGFHSQSERTALFFQLCLKERRWVDLLAKKGAKLDSYEKTSVVTLTRGHVDCVAWLVQENGQDLNGQDEMGYTPLFLAMKGIVDAENENDEQEQQQYLDIFVLLLKQGADVNQPAQIGGNDVYMIQHACNQGLLNCVRALVNYGVDLTVTDGEGYTPLHLAAATGNLKIIWELLTTILWPQGASVTQVNNDGDTQVEVAQNNNHQVCQYEILNFNVNPPPEYTPP